jgi:signal transduction histidine kinase
MRPQLKELFRSSAFRIAGIYSTLFVLSLIVLLAVIYRNATTEFRADLREKIKAETNVLLALPGGQSADALVRDLADRRRTDLFYGIENAARQRLAGNLEDAQILAGWSETDIFETPEDRRTGETVSVIVLGTPLADGGLLAIGASDDGADDLAHIILVTSSWVLGLTALLALAGGLIIYRTSMRRVDVIARSSRDIMTGDLAHRLPLQGSGDEVDLLSESINQMLERIEQLMGSMKQVTSDIAHDLRTPLGRLRQNLEIARESEVTIDGCRAAFCRAIEETDGILGTFDALLRIGTIESGGPAKRFTQVDLSDLVAQLSEGYRPVAEDNGQTIETAIEPGIHINGDRELLTQMMVNLVENGIRHCPAGTLISISLTGRSSAIHLIVDDNGTGVAPEELAKILRPFYRLEQSRSSNGSGLGLALVSAIARLHGINLELADNQPGLRVSLGFPAAANPAQMRSA